MVRILIRKNRNEYAFCILTSNHRVWPSLKERSSHSRILLKVITVAVYEVSNGLDIKNGGKAVFANGLG